MHKRKGVTRVPKNNLEHVEEGNSMITIFVLLDEETESVEYEVDVDNLDLEGFDRVFRKDTRGKRIYGLLIYSLEPDFHTPLNPVNTFVDIPHNSVIYAGTNRFESFDLFLDSDNCFHYFNLGNGQLVML